MSADGARKLFVGGLADNVTEGDLRAVFESAGFVVAHLALPRDRESGRLRGFAFVTLTSEEEASRARSELQGVNCAGRPLSIREFSQEPPKRGPGGPSERPERQPRGEQPTVFLGKLPFEATQEDIQKLFEAEGAGRVVRLVLPTGPDGRPRGFGFATLESDDHVQIAVAKLNGASLMGRQIVVSPAQAKGSGGPGGGGGGRPAREDGPRRGGGGRFGDQGSFNESRGDDSGGGGGGGGGGYDSFYPPEPPVFPPPDRGGGRRREGKKEKRPDKRRGGASAGGEGSARGGARGRRGGGGNWHRWEDDDD